MSDQQGGGHDWWLRYANLSDRDRPEGLKRTQNRLRFAFAFVLIAGGVLLFLSNLGLFPAFNIWILWPLFPIWAGLNAFANGRHPAARVGGVFAILVGALFLLTNFGWIHLHGDNWPIPLLLIAFGLATLYSVIESSNRGRSFPTQPQSPQSDAQSPQEEFVRRGASPPPPQPPPQAEPAESPEDSWDPHQTKWQQHWHEQRQQWQDQHWQKRQAHKPHFHWQHTSRDLLNEFAVLGSLKRRMDSQNFQGGNLATVFGNLEADLRYAAISPAGGMAVLNVNSLFGAVKLRVPREWRIHLNGASILANFEDKTIPPNTGPNAPTLFISGWSVLSSIEIED